jgi:hypothetical protein
MGLCDLEDFGGHNTIYLWQRLPVVFPQLNVAVPRTENMSHRLNTPLRAVVEISGDQPTRDTKEKAVVRRST